MEKLQSKIDSINKDFDNKIAKLNEERNAAISQAKVDDTIARLSSMSIGNIITIFENVSTDILKTRDGKKTINAFVSLVKEDKNIASAYALMESVTKNVGIENPKEFITESVSVATEKSDISTFNDSKKKLVRFVSEALNKVNPVKISEKINQEMNPPMGEGHNPFNLFTGRPFSVQVKEVSGFPNYDACQFFDLPLEQSGMRITINNAQGQPQTVVVTA